MPSRPVAFIKLSGQERGSGRPRRGGTAGSGALDSSSLPPRAVRFGRYLFSQADLVQSSLFICLIIAKTFFFTSFVLFSTGFLQKSFFSRENPQGGSPPFFPPLTVSRFSIFSCPGNSLPVSSSPRLQPEYPLRVHLSSPPGGKKGVGFPTPAGGEVQHPWPEVSDRGGSGRKAAQSLFSPLAVGTICSGAYRVEMKNLETVRGGNGGSSCALIRSAGPPGPRRGPRGKNRREPYPFQR